MAAHSVAGHALCRLGGGKRGHRSALDHIHGGRRRAPGSAVSATGITTSLDLPGAVHVDTLDLSIADTGNHRILHIDDTTGTPAVIAGTGVAGFSGNDAAASQAQLNAPSGVFEAPSGNIFIADSGNHRIRRIADGTITTIAGTGEAGFSGDDGSPTEAQLSAPTHLFVTNNEDSIFVADTGNHRIRVIAGGRITTVAGNGVGGFSGDDSLAVTAQLNGPSGVFSDSTSGRLYIADTNNHRIRYVSSGDTIRRHWAAELQWRWRFPRWSQSRLPQRHLRGSARQLICR